MRKLLATLFVALGIGGGVFAAMPAAQAEILCLTLQVRLGGVKIINVHDPVCI